MERIQENLCISRELNSLIFAPICAKYRLTHTEILILLYLSGRTEGNTARDIVDTLRLAKSHISVSVRCLEERGYLACSHEGHDRRAIHLHLLSPAAEVIAESKLAQQELISVMLAGFSAEECDAVKGYFRRMSANIHAHLGAASLPRLHSGGRERNSKEGICYANGTNV